MNIYANYVIVMTLEVNSTIFSNVHNSMNKWKCMFQNTTKRDQICTPVTEISYDICITLKIKL